MNNNYWRTHKELQSIDDINRCTLGNNGFYDVTSYYRCMCCGRKIKKHEHQEGDENGITKSIITIEVIS